MAVSQFVISSEPSLSEDKDNIINRKWNHLGHVRWLLFKIMKNVFPEMTEVRVHGWIYAEHHPTVYTLLSNIPVITTGRTGRKQPCSLGPTWAAIAEQMRK